MRIADIKPLTVPTPITNTMLKRLQHKFKELPQQLIVETVTYDNQHCPNKLDTLIWFSDGEFENVSIEITHPSRNQFAGGYKKTYVVNGATYAISINTFFSGNNRCERHIIKCIYGNIDDPKLIKELERLYALFEIKRHSDWLLA